MYVVCTGTLYLIVVEFYPQIRVEYNIYHLWSCVQQAMHSRQETALRSGYVSVARVLDKSMLTVVFSSQVISFVKKVTKFKIFNPPPKCQYYNDFFCFLNLS